MCWALYLASDQELPQAPWDEKLRGFNTQQLSENESGVVSQFSFSHVLYLGSHQGCGCGFMSEDDDSEEARLHQETVENLTKFLKTALANGAQLEMFLCWEGDQSTIPVARKRLAASDFLRPQFPLGEKEFAVVYA